MRIMTGWSKIWPHCHEEFTDVGASVDGTLGSVLAW